ncbi:hypothetical protein JTE90_022463, partial [Oedothorax gibbosus]
PLVEHNDEESKQPRVWCVGSSGYTFRKSSVWKRQEHSHKVRQCLQEQTEKGEILQEGPGVGRKLYRIIRIIARGRPISSTAQRARDDVCLYDFVKCYDVVKETKSSLETYKFEFGYVKKRKRECLVSHKIYNVQQNPENYFYSLLLLFKPWRNPLKGHYETYTEAFNTCKEDLLSAVEHHDKLEEIRPAKYEVETLVSDPAQNSKYEADHEKNYKADEINKIEAAGAMVEFRDALANEKENSAVLADSMNTDQKRVFEYVTNKLTGNDGVLRHFVSGVGGTGKSFLIRVLKSWVKKNLKKEVAVCAPTGIAAFNINGLTLHRLLQLPIEHGGVQEYKSLNDDVLQILRSDLKDMVLLIIDEISMVSNISLLYIHLRLSKIFNTLLEDDGWFGKINILFFWRLTSASPCYAASTFHRIDNIGSGKVLVVPACNTHLAGPVFL